MRGQSALILGAAAALIIAVFAVINVDGVEVNYIFGTAEWPLILVILGSVLMGAVITGSLGIIKVYRLQQEIKHLKQGKSSNKEKQNASSSEASPETRNENRENSSSPK
ncbi:LapA family protein [Salibacterium lacus]|uniref:Lipopolysaccharide assembly LapA domain-containing protein n=1 Tax=Salibacterium lacus TaxID=1898109 RepID=A0ABW5SWD8_9BACI